MGTLNLERISLGQVGVKPGSVKMVSSANLATVTSTGYLNGVGNQIQPSLLLAPSDVIECLYDYNEITDTGKLIYLQPLIVNKLITLVAWVNSASYIAVPITAAEFNGMYAAPKLLVPARGANTLLVLDKVQLLMTYNSANYAAGGVTAIQYDSTANGAGVIASSTLAAATFQDAASTAWNFNAGVVAETFSTCVNKGLYLSNITTAFTTGNSAMVAHVWYSVIPTV